jgi:hypothetical protein
VNEGDFLTEVLPKMIAKKSGRIHPGNDSGSKLAIVVVIYMF